MQAEEKFTTPKLLVKVHDGAHLPTAFALLLGSATCEGVMAPFLEITRCCCKVQACQAHVN